MGYGFCVLAKSSVGLPKSFREPLMDALLLSFTGALHSSCTRISPRIDITRNSTETVKVPMSFLIDMNRRIAWVAYNNQLIPTCFVHLPSAVIVGVVAEDVPLHVKLIDPSKSRLTPSTLEKLLIESSEQVSSARGNDLDPFLESIKPLLPAIRFIINPSWPLPPVLSFSKDDGQFDEILPRGLTHTVESTLHPPCNAVVWNQRTDALVLCRNVITEGVWKINMQVRRDSHFIATSPASDSSDSTQSSSNLPSHPCFGFCDAESIFIRNQYNRLSYHNNSQFLMNSRSYSRSFNAFRSRQASLQASRSDFTQPSATSRSFAPSSTSATNYFSQGKHSVFPAYLIDHRFPFGYYSPNSSSDPSDLPHGYCDVCASCSLSTDGTLRFSDRPPIPYVLPRSTKDENEFCLIVDQNTHVAYLSLNGRWLPYVIRNVPRSIYIGV